MSDEEYTVKDVLRVLADHKLVKSYNVVKELVDTLDRVEKLPEKWDKDVKYIRILSIDDLHKINAIKIAIKELTEALHPEKPTEKDKKMEKIKRESIGLVEKKPRWRYDCDRCDKGCKYSPTDTPPCSNMPTVKDWSIAQKKRAIA